MLILVISYIIYNIFRVKEPNKGTSKEGGGLLDNEKEDDPYSFDIRHANQ